MLNFFLLIRFSVNAVNQLWINASKLQIRGKFINHDSTKRASHLVSDFKISITAKRKPCYRNRVLRVQLYKFNQPITSTNFQSICFLDIQARQLFQLTDLIYCKYFEEKENCKARIDQSPIVIVNCKDRDDN